MVPFADDTSSLITGYNNLDLNINISQTFRSIISWLNCILRTLNFDKTHYLEFRTKHYYRVETTVKYEHKNSSKSTETKFLGLIIMTFSWNQHIDQIASKLCSACYVL